MYIHIVYTNINSNNCYITIHLMAVNQELIWKNRINNLVKDGLSREEANKELVIKEKIVDKK